MLVAAGSLRQAARDDDCGTESSLRGLGIKAWLLIVGVFLAARAGLLLRGVDFDFENLGTWWQIADPALLRDRLWATVVHLHGQPPLFNFLIGAALKTGEGGFPVVMAWTYGALSLAGILAFHALAAALLRSRRVALGLALWFCVSPDVLLFNEKLFYDGLVPWLLCIGFWGVHAGLVRGRVGWLIVGFGALAVVVLTRSMFHPIWFASVLALALVLSRDRLRLVAGAALPGAAIAAVLVKNFVLFGFLGLSSWGVLNLVGVTVEKLPDAERVALVADGTLSPLAGIDAFGPIERLLPLLGPIAATGEPVLDSLRKGNGQPNMHHEAMLVASRQRLPDAIAALRADPGMYAVVLTTSLFHFHRPANEFRDIRRNLARIEPWGRIANATVGLQPAAWFASSLDPARPDFFLLRISYGSVLISIGFAAAGVGALRRLRGAVAPDGVVLVLILWTGLFVFLLSSAFDVLENNRARYTVAPLLTLGAAHWLVGRLRSRIAVAAPPP